MSTCTDGRMDEMKMDIMDGVNQIDSWVEIGGHVIL
jgi:hypothetical protein